MNQNPISFLIDYFGEAWVLKSLEKMHSTGGKPGQLPPAQSTLVMIRTHPVVQNIWGVEKPVIDLIKGKIRAIPHTEDFTQLLYLSNDLYALAKDLPPNFIQEFKNRYPTARQEVFIAAAYRISGHKIIFRDTDRTAKDKAFDLLIETMDGKKVSAECKFRLGRDDERTALHTTLAAFPIKIIPLLEKENLNYAVLVHPKITPRADDLLKSCHEILEGIKNARSEIEICNGNYVVKLQKLCDLDSGIPKSLVQEVNTKYSFSLKTRPISSSPLMLAPPQYDHYNPIIIGVGLERLQKETPDYIKGPLSHANKQLQNKEGEFGVVFYQDNHFNRTEFDKNVKAVGNSYSNIDAVVFYAKREVAYQNPFTRLVNPAIEFFHQVSMKDTSLLAQDSNFFDIPTKVGVYSKSCNFNISGMDIKRLGGIYSKLGLF
ncbi:MAG: hypothetical protein Q7K71_01295 [Candidatus Omnitrophota bacterium]|nr:hypothetical protein [Candidatus Omnitrophota bacterium]